MLPIAINHMTLRNADVPQLIAVCRAVGASGVELRNDLRAPVFGGLSALEVGAQMRAAELQVFGLAEVYGFNTGDPAKLDEVAALIEMAQACGAEGIALIPYVADAPLDRADARAMLRDALRALQPMVTDAGIIANIEPLGFENSSLRYKADVVSVLAEIGNPDCFGLIHDTFHHHLAGENEVFGALTNVLHVSGVCADKAPLKMVDADRVLVGPDDRLGNLTQIHALMAAGYNGPLSMEAFAPAVHVTTDPAGDLAESFTFIADHIQRQAA